MGEETKDSGPIAEAIVAEAVLAGTGALAVVVVVVAVVVLAVAADIAAAVAVGNMVEAKSDLASGWIDVDQLADRIVPVVAVVSVCAVLLGIHIGLTAEVGGNIGADSAQVVNTDWIADWMKESVAQCSLWGYRNWD